MPVVVKDYTWNETENMVFVSVPLKGVRPQKVDIFSTEDYLKVHYPPYIFDCWLYHEVLDEKSIAQVGNGEVIFKLEKREPGMWGQIQHPDADDKEKAKEHREAAIKRAQERTEEQQKEKATKKCERDKFAINEQMKLEQEERSWRKGVRDAEVDKATEELEQWKEEQRLQAEKEKEDQLRQKYAKEVRNQSDESNKTSDQENNIEQKRNVENEIEQKKNVENEQKTQVNMRKDERKKRGKQDIFKEAAGDQPLRESSKITVSFTPRVFPTAARESTAPEEQEWLKKQAEARRICEIEDSELSEHERDPVWLRDKGNDFFKKGNYPAAISVYSHAVRMNHKMPALYSNRGACHLKLGNYFKCIEDTSKALELLTPPVQMNASSRLRAHTRRGTALCQLEMYVEGLMDYDAALKIDPKNESLIQDADRIRAIIQGSTDNPDTPEQ